MTGSSPQVQRKRWEDAVQWLREKPDQQELVRNSYYDDPLLTAAKRYRESAEWDAAKRIIGPGGGRMALDIGAGRGIVSYALASEGFEVTALEPDPSGLVGAGAIRGLAEEAGLPIKVVEEVSESLPFADQSFDLIFARAVLHHTKDLKAALSEMARVLKPRGQLVAIREHVISRDEDLDAFLDSHPLHALYGGEHAYRLDQYIQAIVASGLKLKEVITPLQSPLNYWPHDEASLHRELASQISASPVVAGAVRTALRAPLVGKLLLGAASRLDHRPGRLYSFVAHRL